MKIKMEELDEQFQLVLEAETLAEASLLVRFGVYSTKDLREAEAWAQSDGTATGYIEIGARARRGFVLPNYRELAGAKST